MEEIDLSGAMSPETYSDETVAKAREAIAAQEVRLVAESSAHARSRTAWRTWVPTAHRDSSGAILGVSCNCPNGTKGALRARCWHAAALEILLGNLPPA